jgi:hypothetical protein
MAVNTTANGRVGWRGINWLLVYFKLFKNIKNKGLLKVLKGNCIIFSFAYVFELVIKGKEVSQKASFARL